MNMQKLFKKLKNSHGFTLIELLLSIVVAGTIFGIAAETMMREADTYSFITNRKTTIADVRYAMNRMSHELLRVETSDIKDISGNKIDFTDENGNTTSFKLATNGSDLAVYRGSDILIPKVQTFTIEYQDGQGNTLTAEPGQISNVRRIKLSVATEAKSNEGSITLSTTVIPRDFIGYANYQ